MSHASRADRLRKAHANREAMAGDPEALQLGFVPEAANDPFANKLARGAVIERILYHADAPDQEIRKTKSDAHQKRVEAMRARKKVASEKKMPEESDKAWALHAKEAKEDECFTNHGRDI